MKFKLDENFGSSALKLFRERGHDALGVLDEKLGGSPDKKIFEICIVESRCLVTLDLDFADVIRFSPSRTQGVAVLRPPKGQHATAIKQLLTSLLDTLDQDSITGQLWIIEASRIRIHSDRL